MLESHRLEHTLCYTRAHLCTLAVAFSFNTLWWTPSAALRYGGLTFGLAFTAVSAVVAAPLILLQLAVGQVSQQDAVGIWRAVPLFRGVGYLRLLLSYMSSMCSVTYCALLLINIIMGATDDSLWECLESVPEGFNEIAKYNFTQTYCDNDSIPIPVSMIADQSNIGIGTSFVAAAMWISLPFVLFNPVKYMKRIFFLLGPLVTVLVVIVFSYLGQANNLASVQKRTDWVNYLSPDVWQAAFVQALWTSQIAGGYLISSADTLYSNLDVQACSIQITVINIVTSWLGLLLWFAIGAAEDLTRPTMIHQIYYIAAERELTTSWPLTILMTLLISGIITILSQLFPVYDRFRRLLSHRWWVLTAASSVAGAVASAAFVATDLGHMRVLEQLAIPLLTTLATLAEIAALVFIYGRNLLIEDVEFLTSRKLRKCWVIGWCLSPILISTFTAWWVAEAVVDEGDWTQPPYSTAVLTATAVVALFIFLLMAAITVLRQHQYDICAKLRSSLKPSRQWGPRDPITHYYWLARRADTAYDARDFYLPHESAHTHILNVHQQKSISNISSTLDIVQEVIKQRSYSDDILHTILKKQYSTENMENKWKMERSQSLDLQAPYNVNNMFDRRTHL